MACRVGVAVDTTRHGCHLQHLVYIVFVSPFTVFTVAVIAATPRLRSGRRLVTPALPVRERRIADSERPLVRGVNALRAPLRPPELVHAPLVSHRAAHLSERLVAAAGELTGVAGATPLALIPLRPGLGRPLQRTHTGDQRCAVFLRHRWPASARARRVGHGGIG